MAAGFSLPHLAQAKARAHHHPIKLLRFISPPPPGMFAGTVVAETALELDATRYGYARSIMAIQWASRTVTASRIGQNRMPRGRTGTRSGRSSSGWWLVWVAALIALLIAPLSVSADAPRVSEYTDVGDLDPALFPLLDALIQMHDAPSLGPLRSVTSDGRGLLLHFAGLVVLLPEGQPAAATVPPLVTTLLDRQISVTLMAGSGVTYGDLARGAPRIATASAAPALLSAGGTLSALPLRMLAPAPATPFAAIVGGFHVPLPFVSLAGPDASVIRPPASGGSVAISQAADLARAGMPLREPVWLRVGREYRLVQPFTRRVLIWNPLTNEISATDMGDVAQVAHIVPDGGVSGTLLADLMVRLIHVEEGVGVAVTYTTPRGTLMVSLRGAMRFPAASVMKLAILAACEDGIAHGTLQRDAAVDDLEEAMIVYSDNDAANALIDFVGRTQINALMQRIGMAHSYLGSHFDTATEDDDDDNYLVPRESLLLMDELLRGDVGDGARIRDLLSRSEAPGSVRDALANANITPALYEKRGWYDGVENDVTRIDLGPGTTLTLAIFEPDVSDVTAAWTLFADLARLGFDVAG